MVRPERPRARTAAQRKLDQAGAERRAKRGSGYDDADDRRSVQGRTGDPDPDRRGKKGRK